MDRKPSEHSGTPGHQTVTEFFKLKTPGETIQTGFTDQEVSGRAGLLTFTGFLHWHRFGGLLAKVLPRMREHGRRFLGGAAAPPYRISVGQSCRSAQVSPPNRGPLHDALPMNLHPCLSRADRRRHGAAGSAQLRVVTTVAVRALLC